MSAPPYAGSRSTGSDSGTQCMPVLARSTSRVVQPARSKSMRPTATPPRTTTFCGVTSLWETSRGPAGSCSGEPPRRSRPEGEARQDGPRLAGVVQPTQQRADTSQEVVGGGPRLHRVAGDRTVEERQHIAAATVPPQEPRSAGKAHSLEVVEVGDHRRAARLVRSADRAPDPDHPLGDIPARQLDLRLVTGIVVIGIVIGIVVPAKAHRSTVNQVSAVVAGIGTSCPALSHFSLTGGRRGGQLRRSGGAGDRRHPTVE